MVPFLLKYRLHLPNRLTIHVGREHVSQFFPSHLKPNPAPGTRWALKNACSIHGTKQGSKEERGEELASPWLLRKGKG